MSGGSNKAAEQAAANQAQQTANINNAESRVNQIFDNPARQKQATDLGNATTAYYTDQLNTQQANDARGQKFALARNGQSGGSVSTDMAAQSGKDYLSGVLKAQGMGNAAASNLRSSDQQSRANLIAAAQGGLSATDAATQAASSMQTGLQANQASSTASAFGDTFGNMSSVYKASQDAASLRNGMNYAYNRVFQPGFGYGSGAPSGATPGGT